PSQISDSATKVNAQMRLLKQSRGRIRGTLRHWFPGQQLWAIREEAHSDIYGTILAWEKASERLAEALDVLDSDASGGVRYEEIIVKARARVEEAIRELWPNVRRLPIFFAPQVSVIEEFTRYHVRAGDLYEALKNYRQLCFDLQRGI